MNRADKANARKTIPPMIVTTETKQENKCQLSKDFQFKQGRFIWHQTGFFIFLIF